ncbi:MAG: Phytoene synthase [Verrucomicrobiota bacterium]|jgi:phytoene synthase
MQQSRNITQRSASNLALAFIMLPREKRDAMSALYAFCREVDDVADEESHPVEQRRAALAEWRADIQRACAGSTPRMVTNQEFQPVIQRFKLPFELFDDLIRGCEMDLDQTRYATIADLELYCYRVASVVGLLSIEIFGYRNPACRDYAIALGKALQFTNILRDVGNDAQRGRIYLPQTELDRFLVKPEEILQGEFSARFEALAKDFGGRARAFYRDAQQKLAPEDHRAMVAAQLMGKVYWRLLQKIEGSGYRVLDPEPIRLSKPHKLALIAGSWLKYLAGSSAPDFGIQ